MEEIKKLTLTLPTVVPVVTIRDVVMFPGMSLPLSVDREKLEGKVLALPTRDQIDTPIEEHLIVELYSK